PVSPQAWRSSHVAAQTRAAISSFPDGHRLLLRTPTARAADTRPSARPGRRTAREIPSVTSALAPTLLLSGPHAPARRAGRPARASVAPRRAAASRRPGAGTARRRGAGERGPPPGAAAPAATAPAGPAAEGR